MLFPQVHTAPIFGAKFPRTIECRYAIGSDRTTWVFMMNIRRVKACLLALTFAAANSALAAPGSNEAIETSLRQVLPDMKTDQIRPSPIEGVSEVQVGPRLFYVTNDGRYLLQGSLIDLHTRQDISEERRKAIRLQAINAVGEQNMIIFPAKNPRHTVTVFTDVDCAYCRKLHKQIHRYNDLGITVRYLLYPRTGANTPSYYKAVTVWCSENRQDALTRAKLGEELKPRTCPNPVLSVIELGQSMGLQGTPSIVLDDGEMVPGYVPPERLAAALDAER
jgi:thiol:disulfide interchange protein DsbC